MHAVKTTLDTVLAGICVLLFAVLVLTVSWQVFTRQVLDDPSTWSEALAKYLFVWLGLFGAALVFSERGHIAVDLVVRTLPDGSRRMVALLVQLMIVVFAVAVLVWGGSRLTVLAWSQNLPGLGIPLGPMYLVMPITGLIITFYAVHHTVSVLRREEPAGEAGGTSEAI